MTARTDMKTMTAAIEIARRVLDEGIERENGDPLACRDCDADLLQGESHAPGCLVDLAEQVILGARRMGLEA